MRLDRDFSEFIGLLRNHEVRFLVVDGVTFAECYPRRLELRFGELAVPFIGLEDLRRNKAASGRSQDVADLDALYG